MQETMRTPIISLLFTSALLLASVSHAAEMSAEEKASTKELAQNSGCLTCHALTEKIVGPAYSSVAEKYKDQPDAAASLAQSIQYGSKGKWGRIPMPAHSTMSAEDLNKLGRWVMTIQK
jgi:cytochrome c